MNPKINIFFLFMLISLTYPHAWSQGISPFSRFNQKTPPTGEALVEFNKYKSQGYLFLHFDKEMMKETFGEEVFERQVSETPDLKEALLELILADFSEKYPLTWKPTFRARPFNGDMPEDIMFDVNQRLMEITVWQRRVIVNPVTGGVSSTNGARIPSPETFEEIVSVARMLRLYLIKELWGVGPRLYLEVMASIARSLDHAWRAYDDSPTSEGGWFGSISYYDRDGFSVDQDFFYTSSCWATTHAFALALRELGLRGKIGSHNGHATVDLPFFGIAHADLYTEPQSENASWQSVQQYLQENPQRVEAHQMRLQSEFM